MHAWHTVRSASLRWWQQITEVSRADMNAMYNCTMYMLMLSEGMCNSSAH